MPASIKDAPWLYLTRLDRQLLGASEGIPIGAWCLSGGELLVKQDSHGLVVKTAQWGKAETQEANRAATLAFERLLPLLGHALNRIHGTTYDTRFWRITCGYWFRQYLGILYDRYRTLIKAQDEVVGAKVALIPKDLYWVASDTDDYSAAVFSDRLNHQLFGQIIRARELFAVEERKEIARETVEKVGRRSWPPLLKNVLSLISCIIGKFNKIVFLRSYFQASILAKLAIRFHFIPLVGTPRIGGQMKIDWRGRAALNKGLELEVSSVELSDFECLATELIPANIPGVFLEHFNLLLRMARLLRPFRAKLFLTANAFTAQEIYKVWVALSLEEGKGTHVIMQHGGNYGHSDVYSDEEFEIGSCSEYLTSGWVHGDKTHVRPFYLSILSGLGDFRNHRPINNPEGDVIWVLTSLPRFHYTQWSAPQGSAFLEYLHEQVSFLKVSSKTARGKILCRPYNYDYGWNDLTFIEHHCGSFRIDRERKPLRVNIAAAQLVVFTYDSTSMMESMVMNVPTVCFWDPEWFAWRPQAEPLLKRLAKAKVYHKRADLAAKFINRLLEDGTLHQWWSSTEVQESRREYCEQYANTSDDEYTLWSDQIKQWLTGDR